MLLPNLLNPTPTSHHEVLVQLQQRLDALLKTGEYTPFVYPYRAFGPNLLILYLLIPPTKAKSIHYLRYPLSALITYLSVSAIRECRSSMVTVGYGIGLLNAWAVLWTASLIIFNDARADFRRLEEHSRTSSDGDAQGTATGAGDTSAEGLRKRHADRLINGTSNPKYQQDSSKSVQYCWQPLPPTFRHRLDWVLDLVSNFRGTRWNYQITSLPPPPSHIQKFLSNPSLPPPNAESQLTRRDLLRRDLPNFILCIFALDVLKTLTLQDPYYWGLPPSTPSPFSYPTATRLLLSVTFVYSSLLTIYLLAPLIFGVLLGPEIIGQHAWPWLYAPYFGPPSQVWEKGIAGLWGGWWHQLFRYAFEQAGEFAGRVIGWEKTSQRGMMFRVIVAFACSGLLHASASYASLGHTRPIRGAFTFFMLQPVGIIAQKAVTGWMKSLGLREKMPLWLRHAGNLAAVVGWCFLTGPNIADDFAATGIWLYEPLPISPLRGLRGEGWWCWGGDWVRWHTAERWWRSGLAF